MDPMHLNLQANTTFPRNALEDLVSFKNRSNEVDLGPGRVPIKNAFDDLAVHLQTIDNGTNFDDTTEVVDSCRQNSCSKQKVIQFGKRRVQALDENHIKTQLTTGCECKQKCGDSFSVEQILFWREMVHSIPTGDMRMQKIREILRMTSCSTLKYGKNQYFKVEQNDVCRKFFIEIVLGISESTVCRAKLNLLSSATSPVPRKQTHASRGRICVGFIQAYVEATCDRDPTGTVYRMPTSLTKLDLFNLYDIVHQENSLHKSMFYEILKKRFSNVIFSKKQRYTKCKECNEFRELISAEKNVELKKEIIMLRDLHLREQQMEREAYYVRRAQAEMRPGEFLSVILDGMDQKKTNLPYYTHDNNPVGSGQHKLRTHITGSIVHGRGKYFFLDCNQYPHDTNLVLSCLLKLLVKESREGQLPPTLFVQLDNTCRENKNKFFLGMMAFLVKKRFVREVWISFLIVGHTHEDVDQCFSRISVKMRNRNTLTLNELHSVIESSQRPVPKSTDVGTVWNMSAWLSNYVNQIHNVTYPKLYRIFNDNVGHTTVQFKVLSTEDEWRPKHSEKPLEIFKMKDGEQQLPEGEPEIVRPNYDAVDLQDLRRSLEKDFSLAHFTEEHVREWNLFFEKTATIETETWPLHNLKPFQNVTYSSTLTEKEADILRRYKEKRHQYKQVYSSNIHGDRRKYIEGEHVVFNHTGLKRIGQIESVHEGMLTLEELQERGRKYFRTGQKERVRIEECYPGTFDLNRDSSLPRKIRSKYFA